MESNNHNEKLKKLLEAKEKIQQMEKQLVVKSSDTSLKEAMSSLKNKRDLNIEEKINNIITNSFESVLLQARQIANKETEVVFLFDKSASCNGVEYTTVNEFSRVIARENFKNRKDIISTILFNDKMETIHDRLSVREVKPFTYIASGNTALYDTLGTQIQKIKKEQMKDSKIPDKTIFVIMTDGEDNSSKKYSAYQIRELIEERIQAGWEFIYLGVNVNVANEARNLGIKPSNAIEYDQYRLSDNFEAIKKALDSVANTGNITEDWSKPITDNRLLDKDNPKKYLKG